MDDSDLPPKPASLPLRHPIYFIRPPDPGLRYAYHEGERTTLRDLPDAEPTRRGEVDGLVLPGPTRDHFTIEFSGFLEAPADGVYRFFVDRDGDAMLLIGDDAIVDEGATWGDVGLQAGYHQLAVRYRHATGAARLVVRIEGPDGRKQAIPATMLFR